jgi:hypothetical protein
MLMSEVFGYGVENQSSEARAAREKKFCRFRNSACTKASKSDPLGICSLSDGDEAAILCPVRFLESNRIFRDAARIAFGPSVDFAIFPEIRILKIPSIDESKIDKKIGKVDFLLGHIENGNVIDFAALEVQAVYFSGTEMRTPFKEFLKSGNIINADRRPDFRSSAQKRLIPQLELKVPVFRRWGKKFFVVVDQKFFDELPTFATTTQANSEITWLSYPLKKAGVDFKLQSPNVTFSEWDEIKSSLREGIPPDPSEIMVELQTKLSDPKSKIRIFET